MKILPAPVQYLQSKSLTASFAEIAAEKKKDKTQSHTYRTASPSDHRRGPFRRDLPFWVLSLPLLTLLAYSDPEGADPFS